MNDVRSRIEVFAGSDGGYYTRSQVRRRCRAGGWRFCLRDGDSGRMLFETVDRSLVMLSPAEPTDLPTWVELRCEAGVARAVDTRRRARGRRPARGPSSR